MEKEIILTEIGGQMHPAAAGCALPCRSCDEVWAEQSPNPCLATGKPNPEPHTGGRTHLAAAGCAPPRWSGAAC